MNNESELQDLLTSIEKRLAYVNGECRNDLPGRLCLQSQGGKPTFFVETYENGKRHRRKLKPGSAELVERLRIEFFKAEAAALSQNHETVSDAAARIVSCSPDSILAELRNRFGPIDPTLIRRILSREEDDTWASAPFEQFTYKADEKRHTTSHGLKVRTKSELLIAEKLYTYVLPFRYEQVLHVGSVVLAPDFTIRRSDGKLFYWEHEGLTNSRIYLDRQLRKAQLYAGIGIVPWDNYIVTYDNENGMIDLRIIESEIRNRLLI